jgi:hypothetical protein
MPELAGLLRVTSANAVLAFRMRAAVLLIERNPFKPASDRP